MGVGGGGDARLQDHHGIAPLQLVPVKGETLVTHILWNKKTKMGFKVLSKGMYLFCLLL